MHSFSTGSGNFIEFLDVGGRELVKELREGVFERLFEGNRFQSVCADIFVVPFIWKDSVSNTAMEGFQGAIVGALWGLLHTTRLRWT